jgi:hypothetical protein
VIIVALIQIAFFYWVSIIACGASHETATIAGLVLGILGTWVLWVARKTS